MAEANDIALVREFAAKNSETAFAELVRRHINLIYSVAFRFTGNSADAQDVTQAVFIILARKAGSLSARTVLTGWFYETTRFTAARLLRTRARRRAYEQEASMQSLLDPPGTDSVWRQIAPHLEAAMSRLRERDRILLALRFYENMSGAEAAMQLGIREEAARKRTNRALEKLRSFFGKRGVHSSAEIIAGAIAANSIQTAPATLAKSVTTLALTKGAAASISTLTLVKATLIAMKTKTIVAATATAVILGVGGILVGLHLFQSKVRTVIVGPFDRVPIQVANGDFKPDGDRDGSFLVEVDSGTLRTTNSAPSIHIKGPITPDSPNAAPIFAAANGSYKKTDNSSSTRYYVMEGSSLYGKHVRITCWLKTRDVRGWASAFVIILGVSDFRHYQYDDMSNRPIRGTTDWQKIEIVTDLPNESCIIYFGPDLYGPGELWADDFQIDLAPPGTPITDDRNWRITGESDPTVYSETPDYDVTHNGHRTICLTYTPDGAAPRGTHVRWAHDFYGVDSDKYSGHTVRLSGWVKTENVSDRIEPSISPYTGWYKLLARDSMVRDYSLKGTLDWTQFSVTCAVPDETDYLHTGFSFFGSGKVWIDMDSLKFEIVK